MTFTCKILVSDGAMVVESHTQAEKQVNYLETSQRG